MGIIDRYSRLIDALQHGKVRSSWNIAVISISVTESLVVATGGWLTVDRDHR